MTQKNNFYVTTPIYYANAQPHLGTLYSTILADTLARFHKLLGKEVYFLTGTDEHGQKLAESAEKANVAPKAFVDGVIPAFKECWKQYEIEYNRFIRTTDADHEKAVVAVIEKMRAQGDIYRATYSGPYCISCELFMAPETEVCELHSNRPLKHFEEETYFFRLSKYQDRLLEFFEAHPHFITPKERRNEVISFIKSGLKDLSISRRTVKWGIPFPGDSEHTAYVWIDALTNYLTGVGFGDATAVDMFHKWWPADVQVMAKDIIRFHAIYWPAFLMSLELPLPRKLLVHGYILVNDAKMSKSQGNVIAPKDLAERYGVEPIRYYLLRQMAINQDGSFDIVDLENRINADLANSLGNLLNRALVLATNNEYTVLSTVEKHPRIFEISEKSRETLSVYEAEMEAGNFHLALAAVWKFIAELNALFHEMEPWKLVKHDKALFEEVLTCVVRSLHLVGLMLWPVLPKKMESLFSAIGIDAVITGENQLAKWCERAGFFAYSLKPLEQVLFSRIEPIKEQKEEIIESKVPEIAPITIDEFSKVHLVVGTILICEPVPGSTKLLKLQVDLGIYGTRQILSGVAMHFKPDDLIGKQGIYVANLLPRKMMGLESHGMMLFAGGKDGSLQMVTVGAHRENGTRIS